MRHQYCTCTGQSNLYMFLICCDIIGRRFCCCCGWSVYKVVSHDCYDVAD